ncbi:MAG TPA: isochorismatase family protein [Pseudomonadales bacterium]|nr:isochorismatase family protein [Pseudomonadales bacterium]
MLDINNTALVLIDAQGKLAHLMHDAQPLIKGLQTMVQAAKLLDIPVLWAEQLPHKLGATIPELARFLEGDRAIHKSCFSCAANSDFQDILQHSGRQQLLVIGIEAHICVMQSVLAFLSQGYEVHLISDAIGARFPHNKIAAIARCEKAGAIISTCEMALFELMREADHPQFKAVQGLIK